MDQIYIDLRTYFRNSNIQEIEKIQEQLVVQLKSKKVDPEVLDVDETEWMMISRKEPSQIMDLKQNPRMLLFQQSK